MTNDTPQKFKTYHEGGHIWSTLVVAAVMTSAFFSLMNFSEWYHVVVSTTQEYPFGTEGPVPYYYQNATSYAIVTFAWGIIFCCNMIYALWAMLKRRAIAGVTAFMLSLVLLLAMFLHGQIGAA